MRLLDGWSSLLRLVAVGTGGYIALVVMLRVAGKRTLSKMNAFDFVVTVALGSTLASIVTSKDLPLVEGIGALALLITLQVVAALAATRWPTVNGLLKSEPRLLARNGQLLERAMRTERITEDEVMAALRSQGLEHLSEAQAVILESSGDISVIPERAREGPTTSAPAQ